jgi:hypothetical protein
LAYYLDKTTLLYKYVLSDTSDNVCLNIQNCHYSIYNGLSVHIVTFTSIGGRYRSTRREKWTFRKSLTNWRYSNQTHHLINTKFSLFPRQFWYDTAQHALVFIWNKLSKFWNSWRWNSHKPLSSFWIQVTCQVN